MHFSQLSSISQGRLVQVVKDEPIHFLLTDTRKAVVSPQSLFVALPGPRQHGHAYVAEAYRMGIRQFVVEKGIDHTPFTEANFFVADSSLVTLQQLAAHQRKQFSIPVIGITGSNGKTIVKEWLYQLLVPDYHIIKNPGSYNSQMGVPLSVWPMQAYHQLGIFEAGISVPGEMERLADIIQPTLGIFTTIGTAHDEGFESRTQKIREKLKLFQTCEMIVFNSDQEAIDAELRQTYPQKKKISWGTSGDPYWKLGGTRHQPTLTHGSTHHLFQLPLTDTASRENLLHCIVTMLMLEIAPAVIQERLEGLKSVPMRLHLKQGINRCQLIDDTYNNDLEGLRISLDFLTGVPRKKKTLILSDILQLGLSPTAMVQHIKVYLEKYPLHRLIGIGPIFSAHASVMASLPYPVSIYEDTEAFLTSVDVDIFQEEAILMKGARVFRFERIVQKLQRKIHGTVMEIDLGAMVSNLNFFRSRLRPGVKLMVMVKAFAYGSGSEEVASILQYHHVDYLGVAYPDEGVELRKKHIRLPIMVMNSSETSIPLLLQYQLEPEVYSLGFLESLIQAVQGKPCAIHLKLETGMNRLGFPMEELETVIQLLQKHPNLRVASVFSHLAGADDPQHDAYSREQAQLFIQGCEKISQRLGIHPLRHLLNSAGIIRLVDQQFDMVRLGIGLYGVNPTAEAVPGLTLVATLKTTISQLKKIAAGSTIGYGRKGKATSDMTIATIAIGYADGFSRAFSNGVGKVSVNGALVPVIGNVCMDMTMIDVTGLSVREGDEVIVFGPQRPIQEVAASIGTIPYEILTNTSERVKREFFTESL
jgi:alanine racemase